MPNLAIDAKSAPVTLASFKAHVGDTEYAHYETAVQEIHEIGYKVIADTDRAGLLDAKTKDKMIRNVHSYATQNVIKYFQKDARISAGLKKAIGSFEQTGNALISYIGKMKALTLRAAYQETQNSTMDIVKEFEDADSYREIEANKSYGTKKGKPVVRYENIFDQRTVLESKNKDKSYFITAKEGKLSLWEVDNPDYAKMFGEGAFEKNPMMKYITGLSSDINKIFITHWGKTLGSLSFGIASKFRDVDREALLAKSYELNWTKALGVPIHASKKLRQRKSKTRKAAKKYLIEGVMDPLIQKALDFHGVNWSLSREFGSLDRGTTFEQGIYGMLGDDVPGQDTISKPDWINEKLIGLIRKIPFMTNMEQMIQIDELATKLFAFSVAATGCSL